MEKKKRDNNGSDVNNTEVANHKERHIVSWSEEEDDILREQIRVHGTENWTNIASKLKDKTTRQCRRRWFTYLNSDFKKGGWSPEEDMLLCEAQKIFGNKWTEIAKVVSGRTDNAVKNRFTTLCKKRAKHEALAKEKSTASYINLNNKRIIFPDGLSTAETALPLKKMRTYISNTTESREEKYDVENVHSCATQLIKDASTDGADENRGTFLQNNEPEVVALMQQAELHSSLAFTNPETHIQLENLKELVEDLRSSNEGSRPSSREHEVYESSPSSSEYSSTDSTLLPNDKTEECQEELQSNQLDDDDQHCLVEESVKYPTASTNEVNILTCDDVKDNEHSNTEFDSPFNVTPLFRAVAAAIPSPKFSESEKHFLMKTLGMDPTSPNPIAYPSHHRACKRSLLHCL